DPLPIFAIACAAGSVLSPHGLASQDGYHLEINPHRYAIDNEIYANDLFYTHYFTSGRKLLIFWLLITALCAILRKRELWWCWFGLTTGTLPVAFTVDPRAGSSLYLPVMVVAIFASALILGWIKWPRAQWATALAAFLLWNYATSWRWPFSTQAFIDDHRLTWVVIKEFRQLPQPPPHSRILILKNPFVDWDAEFIGMLTWHDHTIDVNLANKLDPPPNPDDFNWVLTFEGEKLRVIKQ